jgi:hypothetical protein
VVTGASAVFMSTFMPDRFNDWMMGAATKALLKPQRKKTVTQAT